MLVIAIIAYCVYFLVSFYTTFMQIHYVKRAKLGDAIILQASKFIEAGNYAVEKQKMTLLSIFYDFILFFLWISFGLEYLDTLTVSYVGWIKAVIFIDLFIILNWFFSLPFELYSTFKLDKRYGFSNMTIKLFIQDTLKTGIIFLLLGSAVIAGLSIIISSFQSWWIWGFIFIFTIIILINMLYPGFTAKMCD
jgi:STE24 endopeptidase